MDLSVQQLRMLAEVASHGTIAAAAESLGYTPSAVSQQLSAAERSTGVAVLERVGRNVMLTDAGRELVGHANTVLAQLEVAKAAIERVNGQVAGTLQVGVLESVASTMLGPLIVSLRDRHPSLRVRTRGVDGVEPYGRIRSGELDLAFVVDYPMAPGPQPADIVRRRIFFDWFRIALPRRRFAGSEIPLAMNLDDLDGEDFVAPPFIDPCGRAVIQSCRRAGFEPDVAHEVTDYPAALRMVAAGVAVAVVPDLGLRHVPDDVVLVEATEPFCRTVELAYRAASSERPVITAVIEAAHGVADELGLEGVEPYSSTPSISSST